MARPVLHYDSTRRIPPLTGLRLAGVIALGTWGLFLVLAGGYLIGVYIYFAIEAGTRRGRSLTTGGGVSVLACVLGLIVVVTGAVLIMRAIATHRQARPLGNSVGIIFLLFSAGSVIFSAIMVCEMTLYGSSRRDVMQAAYPLAVTVPLAATGVILWRLARREVRERKREVEI